MTVNNDELRRRSASPHRREKPNPAGTEVTRYPIHYSPASVADINCDALPPTDAVSDMQLAYREEPASEEEVLAIGRTTLAGMSLGAVVISLALVLLGPVVPVSATLSLSALVVLLLLFLVIRSQHVTPLRIVLAISGPPVVALMLHAVAAILRYRVAGVVTFGLLSVVMVPVLIGSAFPFFYDWLLAHPKLRPKTRSEHQFLRANVEGQAILLLFGIAIAVILTSLMSNSLGVLVAVLGCAVLGSQLHVKQDSSEFSLPEGCRYGLRLFAHYIHYGSNPSLAAGVWYPTESVVKRQLKIAGFLLPCVLTIACATSGFSVWDLPVSREAFESTFAASLEDESSAELLVALAPSADWEEYVAVSLREENRDASFDQESSDAELQPKPVSKEQKEFLGRVLDSSPALWVVVATLGVLSGELWMLWVLVLSIVFGLAISVLLPLAVLRPALKACWLFESNDFPGLDDDERPLWQCFVDRMRSSPHELTTEEGDVIREMDHTFFGVSAVTDYPVILHKPLFDEHCYIVGQTGSGKTALGIMPLLIQLIRGSADAPSTQTTADSPTSSAETPTEESLNTAEQPDASTRPSGASSEYTPPEDATPMVILDLKGDPALFHTVRAEAEARGQEFRFFTPERDLATHVFNPFSNFASQSRTLLQVCQLILDALGLNHGEGYGRSYFTRQNREALFDALNTDPPPQTFKELNDILKSFRGRPNYPDIFELVSTIHALTQYPQLETIEPVSDPSTSIHMPTVLERRQVVYFWLPAAIESITVREIGKLALFSLLSASIDRQRSGQDTRRTYLCIDEFQRLAGENFRIVLEQARSYGLSCFMANQTQADLKLPEFDLRPTVRTNTRVKMHFGVTDVAEILEISQLSGQEIAVMESWAHMTTKKNNVRESTTSTETLKDRLLVSDILNATDHPRRCILHVTRGSGYSQWAGLPTVVDCFYPISRELYVARSNAAWPVMESIPGTTTSGTDVSDIDRQRNRALVEEQDDALAALFDEADGKLRGVSQD